MNPTEKIIRALEKKPELMKDVYTRLAHTLTDWEARDDGKGPFWVRCNLEGEDQLMVAPIPSKAVNRRNPNAWYQWQAWDPSHEHVESGTAPNWRKALNQTDDWASRAGWFLM